MLILINMGVFVCNGLLSSLYGNRKITWGQCGNWRRPTPPWSTTPYSYMDVLVIIVHAECTLNNKTEFARKTKAEKQNFNNSCILVRLNEVFVFWSNEHTHTHSRQLPSRLLASIESRTPFRFERFNLKPFTSIDTYTIFYACRRSPTGQTPCAQVPCI